MKKFKFRLEALQRYKKILEDKKKKEFFLLHKEVVSREMEIADLGKESDNTVAEWDKKKTAEFNLTKDYLYLTYLEHLRRKRKNIYTELDALKKREEIKRNELIEASRQRMTIDKLRENRWKDYLEEYSMDENKIIGELAQLNFSRKHAR